MVFDWFRRKFDQSSSQPAPSPEPEPTPQAAPSPEAEESTPQTTEESTEDEYLAWAKAAYKNLKQRQELNPTLATEVSPAVSTEAPATVSTDVTTIPPDISPAVLPDVPIEVPPEVSPEVPTALASTISPTVAPEVSPEVITTVVTTPATVEMTPGATPEISATIPEITTQVTTTQITTAQVTTAQITPETAPEDTPEPTLVQTPPAMPSLLERAAAERQARMEQFKAEALAEQAQEQAKEQARQAQREAQSPVQTPAQAPTQTPSSETTPQRTPLQMAFDEDFLWSAEVLAKEGRQPDEISVEEITWLTRLRQGLDKTRRGVINQLKAAIGQGPLDGDAVMTLEALLLQADVGVRATDHIIEALQQKLRQESLPPDQAIAYLKDIVRNLLDRPLVQRGNPVLAPEHNRLNIWLITGVNGAGKTTTIGKLAHLAQKSGYRCLIAAADTFRAAAVQQVQVWGERTGVEVIANPGKNTDPAAVVFDALTAAQSRNTELLLIDTAGRLQNKKNLMAELSKIRKTIDKKATDALVESLLVLDSTLGQNGLRQAEVFGEAADLTGVVLTKLDGTAKGGVALGVVEQLNLPIRFIGAGEKITDLRPFSSYEFVEALLNG